MSIGPPDPRMGGSGTQAKLCKDSLSHDCYLLSRKRSPERPPNCTPGLFGVVQYHPAPEMVKLKAIQPFRVDLKPIVPLQDPNKHQAPRERDIAHQEWKSITGYHQHIVGTSPKNLTSLAILMLGKGWGERNIPISPGPPKHLLLIVECQNCPVRHLAAFREIRHSANPFEGG